MISRTSPSQKKQILGLIGWLFVSFAASAVGAAASIQAKSFYGQLAQPTWAPPSWLFFAWHLGAWALADIVLLWALIAVTLVAFWRVRLLAVLLLAPYLPWVSFAAVLNHAVWQLNPQILG